MGICVETNPILQWRPRAIKKLRDVNRLEFAICQLEKLYLRVDVEQDWDGIDRDIWVKTLPNYAIKNRKIRFYCMRWVILKLAYFMRGDVDQDCSS